MSAIPAGTTLRALFITEGGEAYVDLSRELAAAHPGGSMNELLTVYTIVNALTVNLPAVTSVQLLVDGKEVETLAGHVDLRRPLGKSHVGAITMRSDQRPPNQLRDDDAHAELSAARRRLGAHRGRAHESHLHGERRRSRAAVSAQHRQRLGDRRVRHAAARHQHAHAARGDVSGKVGGRTQEIQRLIGRSLRSVTNLPALGERTIWIDCDVIQADGGTRTASITGAFVALALALEKHAGARRQSGRFPLSDYVAAISVGIVDGEPLLDLAYDDDSRADVDMNVVKTGDGRFIEVQGTAEAHPFGRDALNTLLDLADHGIRQLVESQRAIVGHLIPNRSK